MMQIIQNISQKVKTLKYLLCLNPADKKFIEFSRQQWKKSKNIENDGEILVDQMFYDIYIFQLSYIINYLQNKHNLQSRHYHFIAREKRFLSKFFKYLRKYSRINKIYESFGSSYGFDQTYFEKSEKS